MTPGARKPQGHRLTDADLTATVEANAAHPRDPAGAAAALGISVRALYDRLAKATARGLDGSVPAPAPVGQAIKGVSTLYDRNGQVAAQWVKTREDGPSPEDFAQAIAEEADRLRGSAPPIPSPPTPADVAGRFHLFPWPDLHLGMLAWGEETGEDFDLRIAERLAMETFERLVADMPPAGEAILLGLGDLVHFDDDGKRTNRSGHDLDGDSRHAKVRRVAIRLLMWAVSLLLAKFPRVLVRILPGNHDERTAGAIADALSLVYEAEPRVEFDLDPSLWWFCRRGVVQIGATHGHTCKPADMPGVMAVRRPDDWAAAKVRRFYHGHLHNKMTGEALGVPIECLQTIAPPDAWHHGAGYGSGRSMVGIEFDHAQGEVGRKIVNIHAGRVLE